MRNGKTTLNKISTGAGVGINKSRQIALELDKIDRTRIN